MKTEAEVLTMNEHEQSKNDDKTVTMELNMEEFKRLQKLLEMDKTEEDEQKEKEQLEKNDNFIQLYKDNMPEIRWLMTNHAFANNLLFFILQHMDNRNALACSYAVFEDYFGKSRTTIYRAVKILEENGFIDVMKMGTSNVYIVNQDLAWTDKNTRKKYAKYDGKILVSRKENKDYHYQNRFEKLKSLRERENLK